MIEFDELEIEVASHLTIIDSAIALINGFKDRLDAAGVDPAKIAKLKADLDAKGDALAAAVAANVVIEEPEVIEEVPEVVEEEVVVEEEPVL
jgi:hypothetical protein